MSISHMIKYWITALSEKN